MLIHLLFPHHGHHLMALRLLLLRLLRQLRDRCHLLQREDVLGIVVKGLPDVLFNVEGFWECMSLPDLLEAAHLLVVGCI